MQFLGPRGHASPTPNTAIPGVVCAFGLPLWRLHDLPVFAHLSQMAGMNDVISLSFFFLIFIKFLQILLLVVVSLCVSRFVLYEWRVSGA